jgi:invasion protein IalB
MTQKAKCSAKMTKVRGKAWVCAGALVFGVQFAYAQVPQRTVAVYDDWLVSCVIPPEAVAQKLCEMVHSQKIPGQPDPVGQITISRGSKNEQLKIFFQVPANVWLQTGVNFIFDDKASGLLATFRWCAGARCLADADLGDGIVAKLRTQIESGRIEFKEATQREVSIPVSFKGFVSAMDALAREMDAHDPPQKYLEENSKKEELPVSKKRNRR